VSAAGNSLRLGVKGNAWGTRRDVAVGKGTPKCNRANKRGEQLSVRRDGPGSAHLAEGLDRISTHHSFRAARFIASARSSHCRKGQGGLAIVPASLVPR
jgi:hypothetical protein